MLKRRRWFRRRSVGLGFHPVSWQGWLTTLVAVGGAIAVLTAMHRSGVRIPLVIAILAIYTGVALATGGARSDVSP